MSFPKPFTIQTVQDMGRAGAANGLLLSLAAAEGFGALITVDRGIQHQQNINELPIPVIVMLAYHSRLAELQTLISGVMRLLSVLLRKPNLPRALMNCSLIARMSRKRARPPVTHSAGSVDLSGDDRRGLRRRQAPVSNLAVELMHRLMFIAKGQILECHGVSHRLSGYGCRPEKHDPDRHHDQRRPGEPRADSDEKHPARRVSPKRHAEASFDSQRAHRPRTSITWRASANPRLSRDSRQIVCNAPRDGFLGRSILTADRENRNMPLTLAPAGDEALSDSRRCTLPRWINAAKARYIVSGASRGLPSRN